MMMHTTLAQLRLLKLDALAGALEEQLTQPALSDMSFEERLALLVDREGSVWAGTNAGLLRLSDAPFSTWNGDQGLSDDYVRALAESRDGSLWIGTSRGLNRWRGGKLEASLTAADGLPGDSVLSLLEDRDGSLLVGSYTDGLLRLFSQPQPMAKELRNRGLTLVNQVVPLKRWLTRRALDS